MIFLYLVMTYIVIVILTLGIYELLIPHLLRQRRDMSVRFAEEFILLYTVPIIDRLIDCFFWPMLLPVLVTVVWKIVK